MRLGFGVPFCITAQCNEDGTSNCYCALCSEVLHQSIKYSNVVNSSNFENLL